jgi:predicted transcriptional regulator
MSIASIKLDLAKKIIDTDDKEIIGYIKAIFEGQSDNWFEELPADVQDSVERGLAQSERGEVRSHAEVMKKYKKWLKQ